MDDQKNELFEKVRKQFDSAPYPRTPLEQSPKDSYDLLFIHNLATSYYLKNQEVISTQGKLILDAGCGTGYKSLVLAEANPGAQIIGIDLSSEAIDLARQRLKFHNIESAEFIVTSIEDLPKLGYEFDYINCDEVLYLFPDIAQGLAAMKAVLKPSGIIRANLHSAIQRFHMFRVQDMFRVMGLMESNPEDLEIEIARDTFKALKDEVRAKQITWNQAATRQDTEHKEWILMNYLFQGDKGWTIPDLFAALQTADLEFLSMVNWRQWELLDLFTDANNLPTFWAMSLPDVPVEQRLQLFELLHPIHRLLDFWCSHPTQAHAVTPVTDWATSDWQTAQVHLHPQLKSAKIRQDLLDRIKEREPFMISQYVPFQTQGPILVRNPATACLLPLWDGPQTVQELVDIWLMVSPVNPATLEPITRENATNEVIGLLKMLETPMYILLSLP
jgi:ubiquinone/menaquinone biosynthesis C-methylase UbiE